MPFPARFFLMVLGLTLACGDDDGPSSSSGAGSGGIGGGMLTSGGAGASGSSGTGSSAAGMGGRSGAATDNDTCAQGCSNARSCLTTGPLCANRMAADGEAIEAGCLEICATQSEAMEAVAENATRCGLALSVLVDNADLASAANRAAIEHCAPSDVCELACDAVRFCAVNACENRGADGGNIYGACVARCAVDESWAAALRETRDTRGCVAALTRYSELAPGDLPAGCPTP
jgi:hypothetical protein